MGKWLYHNRCVDCGEKGLSQDLFAAWKNSRKTDRPGTTTQDTAITMSLFSNVTDAPPIEVLEMKRRHDEDVSPCKINLTVGGYKVSLSWY